MAKWGSRNLYPGLSKAILVFARLFEAAIMLEFKTLPTTRPPVLASKYIVASGHYLASVAGLRILAEGGNVVDAGIAAGLCLNVVQPDLTSVAGVAPIILRLGHSGEVVTISGVGRWPRGATLEELARRDAPLGGGILSTVVPAALDAWVLALDYYGTMRFADVAAPAIELAAQGFPVNQFLHDNLTAAAHTMSAWPAWSEVFLSRGRPPRVGERLIQPQLARTLRLLVEAEPGAATRHQGLRAVRDTFYKGDIARRIVTFCRQHGGLIDISDFADFQVQVEPPVRTTYREYNVYACGPWCQGPVVLEALNILEGYDLGAFVQNEAPYLHLVVEALKAAFADRHAYYGDPEFVRVPIRGLLAKPYAATWRARIDPARAFPGMPDPGNPWEFEEDPSAAGSAREGQRPAVSPGPDGPGTSYVCVLDSAGNAFSATPSDGAVDAVVVPDLGLTLSNRGTQSWLDPAHPSAVAPGKRPRLTPSPGLVLRNGQTHIVYGTPGTDVQPQAMLQFLLNIIDHHMDVQGAIEAPRVASYSFPGSLHPHHYQPGLLRAESRIMPEVLATLSGMGHQVEAWPSWTPYAGALCAAILSAGDPILAGGADPRRLAYAVGW
jgi:gamma-glutamyltranspeptidase/glutathione hydrolase